MITPSLEKYRQGDYVQYMNNVLEIVNAARATQLNITPQHDGLLAAINQLNEAWQPQTGSELTPEIATLDQQRDLVFTGLKLTVDNWATNHFNPVWRNAAYIIADNIAGHGQRIPLMRYQQQTATINAILQDMNNELSTYINTLGLGDWLTELAALNNSFNHKYVERTQAISGNQPGLVVELMNTTTIAFRQLKTLFDARFAIALAEGAATVPDFQQVENEWSTLTQQYNDAVNRFSGNGEEQQETPNDTPIP